MTVRLYRRLDYPSELRWPDYLIVATALTYTTFTTGLVPRLFGLSALKVDAFAAVPWAADPLLCVLLWQALKLRRAVVAMRGGLIARCWTAYVAGTLLTAAEDVLVSAANYDLLSHAVTSLSWYFWYAAAACFVLAPAYQLSAIYRAGTAPAVAIAPNDAREHGRHDL